MAADNRLLGQFNLEGIAPSPRGMPQIEVKFDIDANGILNVSAKDLGTGKEQTVRIEQSSGLSDKEIENMRHDADEHAAEDKRKREIAELRNQSEAMCFQMEKLLKEHADKLVGKDREAIEAAIEKARSVAKGEDTEAMKAAVSELEQASHALSRTLYEGGPGPDGSAAPQAAGGSTASASPDEEAIDAEFEVKDS
jgi:molecular chaperone DnaK